MVAPWEVLSEIRECPSSTLGNVNGGILERRCWRSESAHHQRKKHRWRTPWEAVPEIRECLPSMLGNIDGAPLGGAEARDLGVPTINAKKC
jgi:hypothetical protein